MKIGDITCYAKTKNINNRKIWIQLVLRRGCHGRRLPMFLGQRMRNNILSIDYLQKIVDAIKKLMKGYEGKIVGVKNNFLKLKANNQSIMTTFSHKFIKFTIDSMNTILINQEKMNQNNL